VKLTAGRFFRTDHSFRLRPKGQSVNTHADRIASTWATTRRRTHMVVEYIRLQHRRGPGRRLRTGLSPPPAAADTPSPATSKTTLPCLPEARLRSKAVACEVPKLCSHRRIARFAGETERRPATRMTPKNSEVDCPDNVTIPPADEPSLHGSELAHPTRKRVNAPHRPPTHAGDSEPEGSLASARRSSAEPTSSSEGCCHSSATVRNAARAARRSSRARARRRRR
jgi:hypothetical protein